MKFLFYTVLFFIVPTKFFAQNSVPLGLNFKNGLTENVNEWSTSKDNLYLMANNTLGEEFMAKFHFYLESADNKKMSIIDINKLPWIRVTNGLNYVTTQNLFPTEVFEGIVSLKEGGKMHVELVTAKSNEKNILGHAQIHLKNNHGALYAIDDSKNTFVVSWNNVLKPGVSYELAKQGIGNQFGILISTGDIKSTLNDSSMFLNVSKGIPKENYVEVDDANTAYTTDAKFALDQELFDFIQIIDPNLLEAMESDKSISKLKTLLDYIGKLKENAEMREMILLVSNDNYEILKENIKSDQVIEMGNSAELAERIKKIYYKIDLLKSNIHPSNTLQANIENIVMLREFVSQLIQCKMALKAKDAELK